jgi:hypothetical protein
VTVLPKNNIQTHNKNMEEEKITGLPENASRELRESEEYKPLLSPDKNYPEVNFRSVTWGLLMAVLFSAAAAYLGFCERNNGKNTKEIITLKQ